jgi:DNA-binding response OmpR family regulator
MSATSHVLIIDDDISVRLCVGDLLAQLGGFALHEAEDGSAGIEIATRTRPDLILLDLMMPGIPGLQVCSALRAAERTREIPIIVLSSAEQSEAMVSALEAGADDFLRKPFSAAELRAKVRTIARLNRFRALAAERDRFRWLIDHSAEPLIVADAGGTLVHANQRAREVFGLDSGAGIDVPAAINRHFRVDPPDAWAAWKELRLPQPTSITIYQPETEQVAAQWFDIQIHALDAAASQVLLKFTNRSQAVRRELETFTFQHLISHKIRTPLNGLTPILNYLSASEETVQDEGTRDLLRLAHESADRLEETLLGILAYHDAVFGRHGWKNNDARVQLTDLIATAAGSAVVTAPVHVNAPALLIGHAQLLEVALTEILENYQKFSEARTSGVSASTSEVDGRWELRFFARGPELPPEVVAQLGRPYAQLEKSFSGEIPGMGLGLATVRLLLRSIGGDLVFANHASPTGLVTTLILPATIVSTSPRLSRHEAAV